ncbi:MAG: tRNA (adenosine(37)-N6)-threonylcarbamoyltransferase complex ATPase subunit type 1 TsaE [Marinifilaceae bacterium]
MKWTVNSLTDLPAIAKEFVQVAGDRKLFALYGSMGVGKTTFVKAVAEELGVEDDVNSPTFAIVNEYLLKNGESIYHFDFYRIKDSSEVLDFGYEEYLYSGNRCFMEWPELIEELLPDDVTNCYFRENSDGTREIEIEI